MPEHHHNDRRGRAIRARLRTMLDLTPGALIPKNEELGAALRLDPAWVCRHKLRVLAEAGVTTTKIGNRIYVGGLRP